jgi:hypothetical protein
MQETHRCQLGMVTHSTVLVSGAFTPGSRPALRLPVTRGQTSYGRRAYITCPIPCVRPRGDKEIISPRANTPAAAHQRTSDLHV